MVEYICDKCEKKFDRKPNYTYHINRTRPCVKPDVLKAREEAKIKAAEELENEGKSICHLCKRQFTRNSSLIRHLEEDRCRATKTLKKIEKECDDLIELHGKDFNVIKNKDGIETIKLIFATMNINGIKDNEGVLWFKGVECANVFGYIDPKSTLKDNVDEDYIMKYRDLLDTIITIYLNR